MKYMFNVLIDENAGSWNARCPAMEHLGAITSGETKEEALTHIHSILLLILLEMERNGTEIPKDEIHPKSIPVDVDTAAE